MKKLIALIFVLLLLAGCASVAQPVVAEEETTLEYTTTEQTTTTTEWTMLPTRLIDFPTSFRGAPEVYWPILRYLYMFNDNHEGNMMYAMDALWFAGFGFATRGNNAYAVADINGDGIDELILFGQFEGQAPHMIALYTQHDGVAVRLGEWTHRSQAVITTDGIIYDRGSNSSESSGFSSYRLEPGATRLTEITFHRTDFRGGERVYQTGWDGEWLPLSEEREAELWATMNPPNPMQFNFIPIEQ